MSTLNGFGTRNVGVYNYCFLEDSEGNNEEFDTTLWFCMFWLPVIPLKSYRIRKEYNLGEGISPDDISIDPIPSITFSKDRFVIIKNYVGIKWTQVLRTYLFVYGLIILFLIVMISIVSLVARE